VDRRLGGDANQHQRRLQADARKRVGGEPVGPSVCIASGGDCDACGEQRTGALEEIGIKVA